jgi:hypothetical protein
MSFFRAQDIFQLATLAPDQADTSVQLANKLITLASGNINLVVFSGAG